MAKPNTFGELDTARIASDTAMEINMDRSYEYHRSLAQNDSTVFDFLAYDKPKRQTKEWESKFIVIKRTKTSQDTVIKSDRNASPVRLLDLADLDQDGLPEIIYTESHRMTKDLWVNHIYKSEPNGKYLHIRWGQSESKSPGEHYHGGDTFFVYQDHLIRRFPYYEKYADAKPKGTVWQSYILSHGKVTLDNEKTQQ